MSRVRFRLVVTRGPFEGRVFKFDKDEKTEFRIGRDDQTDVPFWESPEKQDEFVSRKHGRIRYAAGNFLYVDDGSLNGSFLDGTPLTKGKPVLLKHGDVLQLGVETVVRFECDFRTKTGDTPTPGTQHDRPGATFSAYDIYEALGDSDTDAVDRAVLRKTKKAVALKRFKKHKLFTSAARTRIRDTANANRGWHHPAIAELVACEEYQDTLFLTRRFVNGEALVKLLNTSAQHIDAALAAYIVREACAALAYADSAHRGFVQRFLSHRNVMLSRDGSVVLINFGMPPVFKLLQPDTKLSDLDSRFLSPEIVANRSLDSRTDVFSLGIMLYELLTQQQIDPRKKLGLPDARTVRPEIPTTLDRICKESLSVNQLRRLGSPAELGERLGDALATMMPGYGAAQAAEWMVEFAS